MRQAFHGQAYDTATAFCSHAVTLPRAWSNERPELVISGDGQIPPRYEQVADYIGQAYIYEGSVEANGLTLSIYRLTK